MIPFILFMIFFTICMLVYLTNPPEGPSNDESQFHD